MADLNTEDLVVNGVVKCTGISGAVYSYFLAAPGSQWLAKASNYLFAKWTPEGWIIFYVGETDDTARRFSNHERWQEAVTVYGATHALTHLSSGVEADRKREEADLIAAYNPPMNVQHRTTELAGLSALSETLFGLSQAGRGGKR